MTTKIVPIWAAGFLRSGISKKFRRRAALYLGSFLGPLRLSSSKIVPISATGFLRSGISKKFRRWAALYLGSFLGLLRRPSSKIVPISATGCLRSGISKKFRLSAGDCSAFSLLELLVVIAIIGVLSTLLVPAMRGISGGTNLTAASEEFSGTVNLARQRASTFNRQVAIRFWQDGNNFRSYQLWEQKDLADMNSWQAVDKIKNLPTGVVATNDATFSSLLTRNTGTTNGRAYADVLLTPSGSLVASATQTAVTFVPEFGPSSEGVVSGLPPNFATVTIDPINTIPRVYRP